jgi:hypothetical protein
MVTGNIAAPVSQTGTYQRMTFGELGGGQRGAPASA